MAKFEDVTSLKNKGYGINNKIKWLRIHLGIEFTYLKQSLWAYKRPAKSPVGIIIEPTNVCNLNCIMCPRKRVLERGKGFMNYDIFKKVIDEAAKIGVKRIEFGVGGEPLLHPRISDMIRYSKNKGLYVHINTNANRMNEEISKALLDSGLDSIIFSVDGSNSETYNKIRRGGNYDIVCENIRNFIRLKNEGKFEKPETVLQSIEMKITKEEIESIIQMWSPLVDRVSITGVTEDADIKGVGFFDINMESKKIPCFMLWDYLSILWNGDVTVCCHDITGDLVIGNIFEENIENIWKGQKFNYIREIHKKHQFEKIPKCNNCDFINLDSIKTKRIIAKNRQERTGR